MDLTPGEIAEIDPAYWANLYKIQLQSGPFTFRGHEYEIEPMMSTARRSCVMKATGLGFSEIEILKTLHGLIHRKYKQGVLYLFPTTDNVQEFSKSRFNPLIASNRESIGKFVKASGKGTDTASLKKVHDAFLYLRGARLPQQIGIGSDEKESSQLRGIQVDRVVFDEVDLMDDDVVMKAKGRMGHSTVKEEVYISNPTLPDYGIDKVWQQSDQRHWFRRCGCGEWVCPELSFPDCVHIRPDGTGYIACPKCGKELAHYNKNEWVPSVKDNSDYMEGRRLSQLASAFNDPAEILADYNNPPQGNLADVYRLRLGLPYVAAEDKLSADVVYQCCGKDLMAVRHSGPCAMGVDVGKTKHVVVGIRTGTDRYELLKVIQLSTWPEIHDVARRFNVKSAVIDIRPYEDEARSFQKSEPYRMFLCEYSENTVLGTTFNDNTGIVRVNRTEIFDASHRTIAEKRLALPRRCPEVDEFVKQTCNAAKVLETNKRSGTAIYRYRSVGTGGDHYRNALNYFLLAAGGMRIVSPYGPSKDRQLVAVNDYDRI
jgi:hypothetical protein